MFSFGIPSLHKEGAQMLVLDESKNLAMGHWEGVVVVVLVLAAIMGTEGSSVEEMSVPR